MHRNRLMLSAVGLTFAAGLALAQSAPPAAPAPTPTPAAKRRIQSPYGEATTEVGGKWEGQPARYTGGKWIEIEYYRPIKRGRNDLFGSGAEYGKKLNAGAPVWRAGANRTTRLSTEVPLEIGGKRVAPGEYSLFIDLKEGAWTLIVSSQGVQKNYDANDKTNTWGAYNYDPKFDVARAPMTLSKSPHSVDQMAISFLDVTDAGGKIGFRWDHEFATADFKIVP